MSMTPAQLLRGAADLLEAEGAWTRGEYARNAQGYPVVPEGGVCWCAFGALIHVRHANGLPCVGYVSTFHDLPEALALEEVLWPSYHDIAYWNDHPDRTQAEVVAALREAADRLDGGS